MPRSHTRLYTIRMGWSPLTMFAAIALVWFTLAVLIAWGFSRWMRWLRGDFDR